MISKYLITLQLSHQKPAVKHLFVYVGWRKLYPAFNPPAVITDNQHFCRPLKTKNSTVINAEVPLSNARIARNNVLYTDVTGLCDIALTVKNYVKAIFGYNGPQFKQISKLQFKKLR